MVVVLEESGERKVVDAVGRGDEGIRSRNVSLPVKEKEEKSVLRHI